MKLLVCSPQKMSGELQAVGKPTKHNNQTGRWLTPFKVNYYILRIMLCLAVTNARKIQKSAGY